MKRTVSANSNTRSSVSSKKTEYAGFVVCVDNAGYSGSLLMRKVYPVLEDRAAGREGFIRVVDESGEDYLYGEDRFVPVKLTRDAQEAVLRAG